MNFTINFLKKKPFTTYFNFQLGKFYFQVQANKTIINDQIIVYIEQSKSTEYNWSLILQDLIFARQINNAGDNQEGLKSILPSIFNDWNDVQFKEKYFSKLMQAQYDKFNKQDADYWDNEFLYTQLKNAGYAVDFMGLTQDDILYISQHGVPQYDNFKKDRPVIKNSNGSEKKGLHSFSEFIGVISLTSNSSNRMIDNMVNTNYQIDERFMDLCFKRIRYIEKMPEGFKLNQVGYLDKPIDFPKNIFENEDFTIRRFFPLRMYDREYVENVFNQYIIPNIGQKFQITKIDINQDLVEITNQQKNLLIYNTSTSSLSLEYRSEDYKKAIELIRDEVRQDDIKQSLENIQNIYNDILKTREYLFDEYKFPDHFLGNNFIFMILINLITHINIQYNKISDSNVKSYYDNAIRMFNIALSYLDSKYFTTEFKYDLGQTLDKQGNIIAVPAYDTGLYVLKKDEVTNLIFFSAKKQNLEMLSILMKYAKNIDGLKLEDMVDEKGRNLLMFGILLNLPLLVDLYPKDKINLDFIDLNGASLLMYAAGGGGIDAKKSSSRQGGFIEFSDNDINLLKFFYDGWKNENRQEVTSEEELDYVRYISLLINVAEGKSQEEKKKFLNARDAQGRNAAYYAILRGSNSRLNYLVNSGVELDLNVEVLEGILIKGLEGVFKYFVDKLWQEKQQKIDSLIDKKKLFECVLRGGSDVILNYLIVNVCGIKVSDTVIFKKEIEDLQKKLNSIPKIIFNSDGTALENNQWKETDQQLQDKKLQLKDLLNKLINIQRFEIDVPHYGVLGDKIKVNNGTLLMKSISLKSMLCVYYLLDNGFAESQIINGTDAGQPELKYNVIAINEENSKIKGDNALYHAICQYQAGQLARNVVQELIDLGINKKYTIDSGKNETKAASNILGSVGMVQADQELNTWNLSERLYYNEIHPRIYASANSREGEMIFKGRINIGLGDAESMLQLLRDNDISLDLPSYKYAGSKEVLSDRERLIGEQSLSNGEDIALRVGGVLLDALMFAGSGTKASGKKGATKSLSAGYLALLTVRRIFFDVFGSLFFNETKDRQNDPNKYVEKDRIKAPTYSGASGNNKL